MLVAIGVLGFTLLAPGLLEGFGWAVAYAPWLWLVAIGLAAAGTAWIFRIAQGNAPADPGRWRYRDR